MEPYIANDFHTTIIISEYVVLVIRNSVALDIDIAIYIRECPEFTAGGGTGDLPKPTAKI